MPLFGTRRRQADSVPEMSPIHADPVARVITMWLQSKSSHWAPVGVAPGVLTLHHCSVSVPRPEGRHSVRLPHRLVRFPERLRRSPWSFVPRRDRSTRFDLTPRPVARIRCRLPVVRVSPEGAVRTRSEVAVNSVLVLDPLRLVSDAGRAEAPSSSLRLACALRNNHQLRPAEMTGQEVFTKSQGYPRTFFVTPRSVDVVPLFHTVRAQRCPHLAAV